MFKENKSASLIINLDSYDIFRLFNKLINNEYVELKIFTKFEMEDFKRLSP